METLKKILKNSLGMTTPLLLLTMGSVSLFIFMKKIDEFNLSKKKTNHDGLQEVKLRMLLEIEEQITNHVNLQNSRVNTNVNLYNCLTNNVAFGCNELRTYDMILYSGSPIIQFDGSWKSPPVELEPLLGGLEENQVFFNRDGRLCTNPDDYNTKKCPLQGIIQFSPLCGGTDQNPTQQASPGTCAGPATGLQISYGVGSNVEGQMKINRAKNSKDVTVSTILFRQ